MAKKSKRVRSRSKDKMGGELGADDTGDDHGNPNSVCFEPPNFEYSCLFCHDLFCLDALATHLGNGCPRVVNIAGFNCYRQSIEICRFINYEVGVDLSKVHISMQAIAARGQNPPKQQKALN